MNRAIYRDAPMLMVLGFVALVVLMLPKIQEAKSTSAGAIQSPGQLSAFITWPEGDNDVDLWVTGPGEPHAVGYSAPNGLLWNLLRDDLGKVADLTPGNYENAFTRGEPDGLYVLNVHCYRCGQFPIPVSVELRERAESNTALVVATATVILDHDKQEETAMQFMVKDGKVEHDTLTRAFKSLLGVKK